MTSVNYSQMPHLIMDNTVAMENSFYVIVFDYNNKYIWEGQKKVVKENVENRICENNGFLQCCIFRSMYSFNLLFFVNGNGNPCLLNGTKNTINVDAQIWFLCDQLNGVCPPPINALAPAWA